MSNLPRKLMKGHLFDTFPWFAGDDEVFNFFSPAEERLKSMKGGMDIDLEETNDLYHIKANLPGVSKENVKISFENNFLIITAEDSGKNEQEEKNYVCRERWSGKCSRSIRLPLADENNIDASLNDGVLDIKVNKRNGTETRNIEIN